MQELRFSQCPYFSSMDSYRVQPTHGAKGLQPLQHRPWRAAVMLHVESARVCPVAAVDCRLARADRASLLVTRVRRHVVARARVDRLHVKETLDGVQQAMLRRCAGATR